MVDDSQLSLLQFRDDPTLKPDLIAQPREDLRIRFPVFFHRVTLARIVYKFCIAKSINYTHTKTSFFTITRTLTDDIARLRAAIPVEWRPDHDIFAEPKEHTCVVALHLEFHTLQMQMLVSQKACRQIISRHNIQMPDDPENPLGNQDLIHTNLHTSNARKIFQILGEVHASSHLNPGVLWL